MDSLLKLLSSLDCIPLGKVSSHFSPIDQETRKRTWHGCVVLDRALREKSVFRSIKLLCKDRAGQLLVPASDRRNC